MSRVYSIIVTYNGSKWIEKCIHSLNNSIIKSEIIVIDNASKDDTVSIIENEFPDVEVIKSNMNLGFGKANNIGLKRALRDSVDYVFLLNQDAWIKPDTLNILINTHKKYPEYGIISPIHTEATGTKFDSAFNLYASPLYGCNELISDLYFGRNNEIYKTNFVNAAAWLISAKCLKDAGGFDPIFSHYGEDVNYCQRVLYHDFKIGICINTTIYHDRNERPPVLKNKYYLIRQILIQSIDVNNPQAIKVLRESIFRYFLQLIKTLLLLKINEVVLNYSMVFYIFRNYNRIIKSFNVNKIKGPSWL